MTKQSLQAIVLAAGQATRFNTGRTKLIEPLCGQEMVLYPINLLAALRVPITVVIGHQKEVMKATIEKYHPNTTFIVQEKQKGTGHAIICTKETWHAEHILIINGDMPLVSSDIIEQLIAKHTQTNATMSFVVAHNAESSKSYGRVVKTESTIEIVEAKHFTGDPHEHCCINAGIYLISTNFLRSHINQLNANEKTDEFYITDLVKIASTQGARIETVTAPFDCVRGINTLEELWIAEQIKRAEIIRGWMDRGVRFSFAQNVHIDNDVTIGAGSYIGAGVHVRKGTRIGTNCTVHEFSIIENTTIGNETEIYSHSVIKNSAIGNRVHLGPFAHIRENVEIKDGAVIGNFVEMKETSFGKESKAKHLAYLGNATVGEQVNIGAGTITCNHNGIRKEQTIIEDRAYIGGNNALVAPVTVEKNGFTAAGSVITKTVPADALAIARAAQINKEGYALKLRNESKKNSFLFSAAVKSTNDNNHTPDHT